MGSILGGLFGAGAAGKAAKTEANALNNATAIEQSQFNTTQANLQPWMKAGGNALTALQSALGIGGGGAGGGTGFNTAGFTGSPGYQWQLNQGLDATRNAAGLTGGVNSGNTLKALTQYGQGLADQTWQQYLANLGGISAQGLGAANSLGNFGASNAAQIGANTIGAGQAMAGGAVGGANALTSGFNGLGQDALLGYYLSQNAPQATMTGGGPNLYANPLTG